MGILSYKPVTEGSIKVLNKHHFKPDPTDKGMFYIGRGSALGNPFKVEDHGRDTAIKLYEEWLDQGIVTGDAQVIKALDDIANTVLAGRVAKLVCYCKPSKCHGDVIKSIILKTIQEMKS